MAEVAHVGVGLAAKRVAPIVPQWVLLVGAWVIDTRVSQGKGRNHGRT